MLSRGRPPVSEMIFYDMTAGDGVPFVPVGQQSFIHDPGEQFQQFIRGCSPGIFLRHIHLLAANTSKPVLLTSCEKQSGTHARLVQNTAEWLGATGWQQVERGVYASGSALARYLCLDAKEMRPPGTDRDASCFVYNDPNHIEHWSLTPEFLRGCPKFTTSLSTLGCNVGGLKRIEEEKRREWYGRVEVLCDSFLRPWHDACLFSIGDADQWAYLVTAPMKWRERITKECMDAASKLEKLVSAPPRVVWRKDDPAAFYQMQRFLFLTKDEYKRGVQL